MTSKHWQDLEALFGQAIQLTGEEREVFLSTACGEDSELRRELDDLLSEDESTDTFLDHSLFPDLGLVQELEIPSDIGPYRVLERLGSGGMGVVFRAERQDGEFEQNVAIKFLRRGLTEEAVRRFKVERQILANLDHPRIARLLDGGTTEADVPYVIIELIEGQPVDRWCEEKKLSVEERLDLFLGICDAVSAAHRNLVVHCDLKPSNLLVTREGEPKLLDFGIASLLDTEDPMQDTGSKQRLLTPSYASPEQLEGGPITVATDVYLLGLVLYKLLSGRLPHRLEGRTREEASRILGEQDPQPIRALPSEPRTLNIGAELDAIVLKALRPKPEDRYSSVEQLMEDLRRFQHGLPVLAYGGSWFYRSRKFLRRRWLPTAVLAGVLVMMAAFGFYGQAQARALDQTLQRSQAVETYLSEMVWSVDPAFAGAHDISVSDWIALGIRKLELVRGEPEVEATLRSLFGRILVSVDQQEMARQQLEAAQRLFREEIRDPGQLRLTEIRSLSDLAIAIYLSADSDEVKDEAEAMGQKALELARPALEDQPEEKLGIMANLSLIYCWRGKYGEIAPLAEEMLVLIQESGTAGVSVAEALEQLALVRKNVDKDLAGAQELYHEALNLVERLEGRNHPDVAVFYNQLGIINHQMGDLDQAIAYQKTGLEIRRTLYEEGHRDIGLGLYNLAKAYETFGDLDLAESHLREALEIYQAHPDLGPAHAWTGKFVTELAGILIAKGDSAETIEALIREEIPQAWWDNRAESSRLLAWARAVLGHVLARQGRESEARPLLEQATGVFVENPTGFETEAEQAQAWLKELAVPERVFASPSPDTL